MDAVTEDLPIVKFELSFHTVPFTYLSAADGPFGHFSLETLSSSGFQDLLSLGSSS